MDLPPVPVGVWSVALVLVGVWSVALGTARVGRGQAVGLPLGLGVEVRPRVPAGFRSLDKSEGRGWQEFHPSFVLFWKPTRCR